jgi:hypothetical protein
MSEKRGIGWWILMIGGTLLFFELLLGQTLAFISYDLPVSIGLQEAKEIVGEMGVAVNKGFGVGDTIVYVPLLVIGLAGLWARKMWGVFAMAGVMAITAYWPMVCLFLLVFAKGTPGFHFTSYTSYTIVLTLITLYGLWGLGYVYACRNELADKE